MPSMKQLDHLVGMVGQAAWRDTGVRVPLRWCEGAAEDRAARLLGPDESWAQVGPATIWGAPQRYFWFAGDVTPPEPVQGKDLWLRIDAQFGRVMGRSDPQCLVRLNGQIVQGGDFNHTHVPLRDQGPQQVMIEAGTIEDRHQIGFGLSVMARDITAEALYFDLLAPLDVARHLPENDHRRDLILNTVYAALNTVDLRDGDPDRRARSVRDAREIAQRIYRAADTEVRPQITVTGHTHIDVAWLWRVRETRQKMARSVATALGLMQDFPDYIFMYNQGYLLDTLQQDYPALFDALRDRQRSGQVEIEGALWLEPDANMTGGEALVRHITRGIRYHRDRFGVDPKIVWLPDTFGYSPALPQLMALAGQEVFVTHKMSWNDTNRMPHEIFWWEGIDGTRVPTYFLTTQPMESQSKGTTYCPDLRPSHVMGAWRRYSQKGGHDRLWLCYGHGDGGGGPTREMLEMVRRMEQGIPGCPSVTHGTMGGYFTDLVDRMQASPGDFPAWVGELYLEFHRGTFTSVAEVKRNNRRGEAMLRRVECLAVLAFVRLGRPYPRAALDRLWDVVLLNQFHDILPGSSIPEVYADSRAEFAAFFDEAEALQSALLSALGGGVVNPFGSARGGLVWVNEGGQPAIRPDGTKGQLMQVAPVPGGAIAPLQGVPVAAALVVAPDRLENDLIAARFDEAGRLVSLVDKRRARELLNAPVTLDAYRDMPAQFEAWDIDETYEDQIWPIDTLLSVEVVESGPCRAALRMAWRYERSTLVQVISLAAEGSVLEFDTSIDWQEPKTLLKAGFAFDLRTNEVIAETQFGHVRRPTHRNTSWDAARFEHPMHRWVAMCEPGQGVVLLNDCKYGYDAQDSTLRLTLLRAPTWPWEGADIGAHRFRYGIAPVETLDEVPALAEVFNDPLVASAGEGAVQGLVTLPDGIALEAMKLSEDGEDVILRLCERFGRRQVVDLDFDACVAMVHEADLLEAPGAPVTGSLSFGAFQIRTLRLTLKG